MKFGMTVTTDRKLETSVWTGHPMWCLFLSLCQGWSFVAQWNKVVVSEMTPHRILELYAVPTYLPYVLSCRWCGFRILFDICWLSLFVLYYYCTIPFHQWNLLSTSQMLADEQSPSLVWSKNDSDRTFKPWIMDPNQHRGMDMLRTIVIYAMRGVHLHISPYVFQGEVVLNCILS